MINDQQLAKLMRTAAKDQLYAEGLECSGEYLISNTYMVFKVNEGQHKKTMEVIAGALKGLPAPGEVIAIKNKERVNNPHVLSQHIKLEGLDHELTDTGFLKELSVKYHARVLVNSEFVSVVDNDFFRVAPGKEYRTDRQWGQVAIFEGEEYLGMILPIRLDRMSEFNVFIPEQEKELQTA